MCLLVVGLLAFSMEVVVFLHLAGVIVAATNLARPFAFNFIAIMVSIFVFLVAALVLFLAIAFWVPPPPPSEADVNNATQQRQIANTNRRRRQQLIARQIQYDNRAMSHSAWLTIVFLPFTFVTTLLTAIGVFGITDNMSVSEWPSRLAFFIPRTTSHLSDLDQAFTLAVGIVALLFSIRDTFKALREEVKQAAVEEAIELKENRERQKKISHAMKHAKELQVRYEECQNEAERMVILQERNAFLNKVISNFMEDD